MKAVICNTPPVSIVTDGNGNRVPLSKIKAPERGKHYRATGEYRANGFLYYFLMGFGIKTVFRADHFQDA